MAVTSQMARKVGAARWETHSDFYDPNRPFGELAVRHFCPEIMEASHWHGHIEGNFLEAGSMRYWVAGREVQFEGGQLLLFWAGQPHQTLAVRSCGGARPRMFNIYLPFDQFLLMDELNELQWNMLNGAMVRVNPERASLALMRRWLSDFQSRRADLVQLMLTEIHSLLRREEVHGLSYLLPPRGAADPTFAPDAAEFQDFGAGRTGHYLANQADRVFGMVRFILANLDQPLSTREVAASSGLHPNYAQALFKRVMRATIRRFVLQMRLIRAHRMLQSRALSIEQVSFARGFYGSSCHRSFAGRCGGWGPVQVPVLRY